MMKLLIFKGAENLPPTVGNKTVSRDPRIIRLTEASLGDSGCGSLFVAYLHMFYVSH